MGRRKVSLSLQFRGTSIQHLDVKTETAALPANWFTLKCATNESLLEIVASHCVNIVKPELRKDLRILFLWREMDIYGFNYKPLGRMKSIRNGQRLLYTINVNPADAQQRYETALISTASPASRSSCPRGICFNSCLQV